MVHCSARLTYEVARELWGKGIATEAARAVLGYGFDTVGLNRVDAYCREGNAASQRVLEKVGMRYEGMLRQLWFLKGAYRNMRFYSALAAERRASPDSPPPQRKPKHRLRQRKTRSAGIGRGSCSRPLTRGPARAQTSSADFPRSALRCVRTSVFIRGS